MEHNDYPPFHKELERLKKSLSSKSEQSEPSKYGKSDPMYASLHRKAHEYLQLPEAMDVHPIDNERSQHKESDDWVENLQQDVKAKWLRLRRCLHSEPGTAFSFEDWKEGKNGKCIRPRGASTWNNPNPKLRYFDKDHKFEKVCLEDSFATRGLQVIAKVTSIELRPGTAFSEWDFFSDSDLYAGDDAFAGDEQWQSDGTLNEHIAATAIYIFEDDNTTEKHIEFRQPSRMEDRHYETNYDLDHFQAIFDIPRDLSQYPLPASQELGAITACRGRLLAFPATLQRRWKRFKIQDPTKFGRVSFLTLMLVDPYWRIASTRNVPPQQPRKYDNDVVRTVREILGHKLPAEITNQIVDELVDWDSPTAEALRDKALVDRERLFALEARVRSHFEEVEYLDADST